MSDENGAFLDVEDADFDTIGREALKELQKRFLDDPSALPSTFLMKFVLDHDKRMDGREHEPEDAQEFVSVRTIIDSLDLEPERKKELLLAEKRRLEEELLLVNHNLEGM